MRRRSGCVHDPISTRNTGFLLNGQHVEINGVCDHADLGALGTVVNTRALQRQIEILQSMGCNAIRTSHNPPAPELLDLCDRMGMLVMDEAFDCWVQTARIANDYHVLISRRGTQGFARARSAATATIPA